MATIEISVGEHWARRYKIEADSFDEAVRKYRKWMHDNSFDEDIQDFGPEFLDDIPGDILDITEI